ncbi:MAG: hypothetical protein IPL65_11685 [Lewinellaceae bacterium]|nr:hypothetical protein [Lewinellaceae bacterium]
MKPFATTQLYLLLLTVLALSSCGSDNKSVTPAGTLFIRVEGEIVSLNPLNAKASSYARFVSDKIFQTLGIVDPESLELKPLLIKSIPSTRKVTEGPYAGKIACDFEIWEDAFWDNGEPITGNDFIFTMKLIHHPLVQTGGWDSYFENFAAIDLDPANPKKFTIYLNEYYILAIESMCQVPIYPAYNYDPEKVLSAYSVSDMMDSTKRAAMVADPKQIAFADAFSGPKFNADPAHIIGSGPYLIDNFSSEQGITLVRKAKWWGDKLLKQNPYLRAYPEKIVYRVVKKEEVVENMLRNQELDVALNLNANKFLELKADTSLDKLYDFNARWTPTYNRMLLNLRNPKLSDKKVRQAMAQLVDYNYLLKSVAAGFGERTIGQIPPAMPYYAKNIKPYEFAPAAARQLLEEAGWKDSNNDGVVDKMINGQRVELIVDVNYVSTSATTSAVANSLVETMRQGGVKLNLVPLEFAKLIANTRSGNYETALLAASLDPGLADFAPYYRSNSVPPAGENRSALADPELDKVIDLIRTTEDTATRNKYYVQAQEIIYDDCPELFLYYSKQRYIVSKRFDYVISSNRPGYYEQFFKLKTKE